MVDAVLIAVAILSVVTFILVIAILLKLTRVASVEPLTRDAISQLLRTETDLIKRAADDQSRSLRDELAERVRDFQTTTTQTFTALFEGVNNQMRSFGERLDVGVKAIDQKVAGISEKLDADITRMGESAERNRETLRTLIEAKLDASTATQTENAKSLREELGQGFRHLGGQVATTLTDMNDRQKERLEQTTKAIEALTEKNQRSSDELKQAVEARLEALRQENSSKLDQMRQTVDEKLQSTLETRLGESFTRVVEQLTKVHEGLGEMKSLASNVGDLKNVLTNVKVRGTFGEVQLELLLEQFLTSDQYIKNAAVKERTSERVEFAVKLPGKRDEEPVLLAIDAKFPREVYDRLLEASDAGNTNLIVECRKQLEAQIRACAKEICTKYINPPKTTDFAILFLPTESLYAEVLRQSGLFEGVQRDHKVTIAGPSTLAAILNALQMGFRTLAIEKRSSEVRQVLGAVRTEFNKYNSLVEKASKQLDAATRTMGEFGTRTRAVVRTLKNVEVVSDESKVTKLLGLNSNHDEEIDGVEILVREQQPIILSQSNVEEAELQ